MKIATSRYQAADLIRASGLAPVGTTVGRPRFKLGYTIAGWSRKIAPVGLLNLDGDEFEHAYRQRLARFGVDAIRAQLQTIAAKAGAPGVVCLCFEDVLAGEACHRRTFAAWWEEQTGEPAPELRAHVDRGLTVEAGLALDEQLTRRP